MTQPARSPSDVFSPDLQASQSADFSSTEMQAVALLRQIARGEHAALEKLYQAWAPSLLGIALRMVKNRADAEEIMQVPNLIPISAKNLLQTPTSLAAWPAAPPAAADLPPNASPVVISMTSTAPAFSSQSGVAIASAGAVQFSPADGLPAPPVPDAQGQFRTTGELQATIGVELAQGAISSGNLPLDAAQGSVESVPDQHPPMAPNTHATVVYDVVADSGQIILKNLPAPRDSTVYRLYLTFAGETEPRFVGAIPFSDDSTDGVLSFTLSRKGWVPTASHLTYEAADQKPGFQSSFVVLQGM